MFSYKPVLMCHGHRLLYTFQIYVIIFFHIYLEVAVGTFELVNSKDPPLH